MKGINELITIEESATVKGINEVITIEEERPNIRGRKTQPNIKDPKPIGVKNKMKKKGKLDQYNIEM